MGQEQLKNLSILAIEKKLASELSLDDVVDCFASKDKNTRITLLYVSVQLYVYAGTKAVVKF